MLFSGFKRVALQSYSTSPVMRMINIINASIDHHATYIFNLLGKLHDFWFLYFHHERNRLHNTHNLRTICDHDAFINFISINLLIKCFSIATHYVQLMRCKYWRLSFFLFWFRSAYCDKVDELRIKFLHNVEHFV